MLQLRPSTAKKKDLLQTPPDSHGVSLPGPWEKPWAQSPGENFLDSQNQGSFPPGPHISCPLTLNLEWEPTLLQVCRPEWTGLSGKNSDGGERGMREEVPGPGSQPLLCSCLSGSLRLNALSLGQPSDKSSLSQPQV